MEKDGDLKIICRCKNCGEEFEGRKISMEEIQHGNGYLIIKTIFFHDCFIGAEDKRKKVKVKKFLGVGEAIRLELE